MPLTPDNWNAVVAGRWNRAILTPSGIAHRLFELVEGTNIEVLMPLDEIGRYQVKHDRCIVEVTKQHLLVQPVESSFENLHIASDICCKALASLPETPLTAVGINIRYAVSQDCQSIRNILTHASDLWLADHDETLVGRSHRRSLSFKQGMINIEVSTLDGTEYSILFNVERASKSRSELTEWLRMDSAVLSGAIGRLLTGYLGIDQSEIANNGNQ